MFDWLRPETTDTWQHDLISPGHLTPVSDTSDTSSDHSGDCQPRHEWLLPENKFDSVLLKKGKWRKEIGKTNLRWKVLMLRSVRIRRENAGIVCISEQKKLQAYVGIAARKFSILFTFIGSSFQLIWFDVLTFEAFCSYLVPLQWLLFSIKFGINYRFSISKPFLFTFGRSEYLFPVTLWLLGSHATIKVSFFGLQ